MEAELALPRSSELRHEGNGPRRPLPDHAEHSQEGHQGRAEGAARGACARLPVQALSSRPSRLARPGAAAPPEDHLRARLLLAPASGLSERHGAPQAGRVLGAQAGPDHRPRRAGARRASGARMGNPGSLGVRASGRKELRRRLRTFIRRRSSPSPGRTPASPSRSRDAARASREGSGTGPGPAPARAAAQARSAPSGRRAKAPRRTSLA